VRPVRGRATAWASSVLLAALVLGAGVGSVETTPARVLRAPTAVSAPKGGLEFDVPFAPILIGHLSATRACVARDFTARVSGGNGATGHTITYVHLTDMASTPCRLEGYPRVVADVPGRSPVMAGDGGGPFTTMAVDPVVVGPGMSLFLSVETERDCPARYADPALYPTLRSDSLSIGLPGGSLVVVEPLDVLCGMSVSPFVEPPPVGPLPHSPPAFALQPEIRSPRSVAAGAPIPFDVVLRNRSSRPVSLSPCPWFTETSGSTGTSAPTAFSYLVNCGAAPGELGPRDALVLSMELSAPPGGGGSVLTWTWGAPYQEGGATMSPAPEREGAVTLAVR
jgi:hypothetical protein